MLLWGHIGFRVQGLGLGLYWDNAKGNGNYYDI